MALSWHPNADFISVLRRAGIGVRIPLRRDAELECGRGFHFGVAPSWHPDADSASAWRPAGMRARILFRRGAQQESGREFYLGVAPSWHPDTDFTSASRRARIRTRISSQRGAELASKRGFHFGVAPSWHPGAKSTSAFRRAEIRTRILPRRGAELEFYADSFRRVAELTSVRGFHLALALSWTLDGDSISASPRAGIRARVPSRPGAEGHFDADSTSAWCRANMLVSNILPNLSFSYMLLCKLALCSYIDCRDVLSRPMQQANRSSADAV